MKLYKKHIYLFIGVLIFLLGRQPAFYIMLIGLAIWSLGGVRQALQALTLGVIIFFLNKSLYSGGGTTGLVLRWIVLLFASFSIFVRVKTIPKLAIYLFLFVLSITVTSSLYSYSVQISLFKIFSFSIGTFAIILGFNHEKNNRDYWESWFYSIYVVTVIYSLLLYPTGLGVATYNVASGTISHFVGLYKHPNAYGVYMSITISYILGRVLFENKGTRFDFLMLFLGIITVFLSKTRGAIANIGISFILFLVITVFTVRREWLSQIRRTILAKKNFRIILFSSVILLLNINVVVSTGMEFVLKRDQVGASTEDIYGFERLARLQWQIDNINKYPWEGIGFGIHSRPEWWINESGRISYDPIFHLPIGASVEKGMIFLSILEENGIIGASLCLLFFFIFFRKVYKQGSIASFLLALACLFVNISEAILFSLGGLGLYAWLMFGFSTLKNDK